MYSRDKPIVLKGSTSALCNNLSVQVQLDRGAINYAVAHKGVVNLVTAMTDGSSVHHKQVACKEPTATNTGASIVLQVKFVQVGNRLLLVMASQKGIQVFEGNASSMLYWYAIGDAQPGEAPMSFARGICGVGSDTLCVGTHEGLILVFDIPQRGTNITLSESLKGHRSPICDLYSAEDIMASSDEAGDIIVWKVGDRCKRLCHIPGEGWPCSSICLWGDLIVGGFGNGEIKVFSSETGKLVADVTAHARWVTSVDVASESGMILSTSEDAVVSVWRLKEGANPMISHQYSDRIVDQQLQGGQFIDREGRAFGVTGYDSCEIAFYRSD